MKHVAIIGAGPAGMMTGIYLKYLINQTHEKIEVTILEKNERVGKKILSTGNGKCNYSNKNVMPGYYNNEDFVRPILESFSVSDFINFFKEKGLVTKIDSEGRMYPITETATSVIDLLRMELHKNEIKVITSFHTKEIKKKSNGYILSDGKNTIFCDFVVIATGGLAAPVLGSTGDGFRLLGQHGISKTKTYPGLVGLKTTKDTIKGLSGLRMKGIAKLLLGNDEIYKEAGEIQFKDDGISGIVIMNITSKLVRLNSAKLLIDFMPNMEYDEIKEYIYQKIKVYENFDTSHLFVGLLPNLFATKILKDLNINLTQKMKYVNKKQIDALCNLIKEYPIDYTGTYDYDRAQVTVGGISLEEVNESLELKKLPNVYVCGELLDIDGLCGGYNLHFAFASGVYVAKNILLK